MATMIPAHWEDRNGSYAEETVYRRLERETPEDWYGIHSVGLTSHEYKSWTDLDFVLVGPFGVVCLEVKGGRIKVEQGRWYTNEKRLKEDPYRQAGGGAGALRRELRDRFPPTRRALVEYAVAFPDVEFREDGPGIEPVVTYDARDLAEPFEAFVERVVTHWRERHGLEDERFRPLSRAERSAIVSWVCPSFDLVPSLHARVANAEAELVELTERQCKTLRLVRTLDRALIRGGAGTGKTLLAVDEASRFAAQGKKVLLACRSPLLADYIASLVPDELVDVEALEPLMRGLIQEAGREQLLPDADEADLVDVFLPEQAAESALELECAGGYDALILDEAQDLLTEGALDLLGILLDGGLTQGVWRVFIDQKQNVFSAVDRQQFERLTNASESQLDLVDNCRNTPEIVTTTCMLAAVDPDEVLASDGPDVQVKWALDRNDQATIAAGLLSSWIKRGIEPGSIAILGEGVLPPAPLVRALPKGVGSPMPIDERTPDRPLWCTIEDFKGQEASAVIVTGITELTSREARRRIYVGCSRARTLLGIVLDENAREEFNTRATEFARRQLEVVTGT